jgi:hypothetical protein
MLPVIGKMIAKTRADKHQNLSPQAVQLPHNTHSKSLQHHVIMAAGNAGEGTAIDDNSLVTVGDDP